MGRGTPLPIPTSFGASVLHLLVLSRPTFHFFPTPMPSPIGRGTPSPHFSPSAPTASRFSPSALDLGASF